jgi:hypothetical protein
MAAQLGLQLVQPGEGAPANTPRSGRPMKNGISRPGSDTKTGKVWAVADAITATKNRPATIKELMASSELRGMADATIRTQYARWRGFNGISGRVQDENGTPQRTSGGEKRIQQDLTKVNWPEMPDSEFFRYDAQERDGELPENFKPWLEQERNRRNAMREQKQNSQAMQTSQAVKAAEESNGTMTDEVYERLALLEKNNNLPANLKDAFQAESARRNAQ